MKVELENKNRMDELSKLMDEKKAEIDYELVPGSYYYDVEKVNQLKEEYESMKEEYEKLDSIPTRDGLENDIKNLNSQLELVIAELREFSGAYAMTDEMLELDEERKEIIAEINDKEETKKLIEEIEKLEKEVDELKEYQNENYQGAYFIPEDEIQELDEKEKKLEELKEKFAEKCDKLFEENKNKPKRRIERTQPEQPQPEQPQPEQPQPEQPQPEQPQPEQPQPEQPQPEQPQPEQPQPEPVQPQPMQASTQITIGKNSAIKMGNVTYKISEKTLKEGLNLSESQIDTLLNEYITNENEKSLVKALIAQKKFDPAVLNIVDKTQSVLRSDKTQIIQQYVNKTLVPNDENNLGVQYDMDSLSKVSLIKRLFKKELNNEEKFKIVTLAKNAEKNGIATTSGEYKLDWKEKFISKLTKQRPMALASSAEMEAAYEYNKNLYGKTGDDFKESMKVSKENMTSKEAAKELKSLAKSQQREDEER